jgi:hypothetical protein
MEYNLLISAQEVSKGKVVKGDSKLRDIYGIRSRGIGEGHFQSSQASGKRLYKKSVRQQ